MLVDLNITVLHRHHHLRHYYHRHLRHHYHRHLRDHYHHHHHQCRPEFRRHHRHRHLHRQCHRHHRHHLRHPSLHRCRYLPRQHHQQPPLPRLLPRHSLPGPEHQQGRGGALQAKGASTSSYIRCWAAR